jgi:peroxiredoxin/uncharacterized membrane protein YphA (DoxX/SURF4 family)
MLDSLFIIARLLLAAVFVAAALNKLRDRNGSQQALANFGVPAAMTAPIARMLPVVELGIALALVPTVTGWWGALGALAILLLFSAGIIANLARGRRPVCHCFGLLGSKPIGWLALARNAVLAGVAGLVLIQDWLTRSPLALNRPDELGTNTLVAFIAVIVAVVVWALTAQGLILVLLHKRIKVLETRLAAVSASPQPAAAQHGFGLPTGVPAPLFRLSTLTGEKVALADLYNKGKTVMLVFTDPQCQPCKEILPDVGRWQRGHAAQLTIMNVSRGPLDVNRNLGSKFGLLNVLVQEGEEVTHAYRAFATPSAMLVRPDGVVGSPLALGIEEIRTLIQKAADSQTTRQPVKRAQPAAKMALDASNPQN